MVSLTSTLEQKKGKTELILKNIFNLPPVPKALQEVLNLLDDPKTINFQLTNAISTDQGLVTKILTIANSPLFGLQRKVTTIDFALLILGHHELRNIVSVLSIVESFKNKTDKYMNQKTFWLHSFLTGTASKKLADDLDYSNSGEAFVAGFLHDVGLSIIHRFMHSSFIEIYEMVKTQKVNYQEAELEVLGMTHEQIGQYLFEKWNFPEALCDAIHNHHNPENSSKNKMLASIVHMADFMAYKFSNGDAQWDKGLQMNLAELAHLRITSMGEAETFINDYKELFIHQIRSVRFLN